MKKLIALIMSTVLLSVSLVSCFNPIGVIEGLIDPTKKEREYHDLVLETKEIIDDIGDDIYNNWYDAIYRDKFDGDINEAIAKALEDNKRNIATVYENNEQIKDLYSDVRDGDLGSEVKDVMHAYNDYYVHVMEVSGSFSSFSAKNDELKKELASALSDLEMEL